MAYGAMDANPAMVHQPRSFDPSVHSVDNPFSAAMGPVPGKEHIATKHMHNPDVGHLNFYPPSSRYYFLCFLI